MSEEKIEENVIPAENETIEPIALATPMESTSADSNADITKKNLLHKLFLPENKVKTIAFLAAFVVIVAALFGIIKYNSAESVAERFIMAQENGAFSKYSKLYAWDYKESYMRHYCSDEDEFFNDMSDVYDEDIESWRDYSKCRENSIREGNEEIFGEYKLTTRASNSRKVSCKKMKNYFTSSEISDYENYGFDFDEHNNYKIITVKIKFVCEDSITYGKDNVYMVKCKGLWKVICFENID